MESPVNRLCYVLLLSSMTACSWSQPPIAVRPSANPLNPSTPIVRQALASSIPISSIAKAEASPLPSPEVSPSNTLVLPIPSVIASSSPTPSPSPSLVSGTQSSSGSSGGGGSSFVVPAPLPPTPAPTPTPLPIPTPTMPPDGKPVIHDVRLADGPSILGAGAPGALRSNYLGGVIQLHAIGYFFEPSIQDVSVLLDNRIAFNLIDSSNYVLKFQLETQNIPDLYLEGAHRIKVTVGNEVIEDQVLVGVPITQVSLFPQISEAEIITQGNQKVLRVSGKHLMLNPRFSQAKIDGTIVPVLQVTREANQSVMQISLPAGFDENTSHQLVYSSPFGVAFKSF